MMTAAIKAESAFQLSSNDEEESEPQKNDIVAAMEEEPKTDCDLCDEHHESDEADEAAECEKGEDCGVCADIAADVEEIKSVPASTQEDSKRPVEISAAENIAQSSDKPQDESSADAVSGSETATGDADKNVTKETEAGHAAEIKHIMEAARTEKVEHAVAEETPQISTDPTASNKMNQLAADVSKLVAPGETTGIGSDEIKKPAADETKQPASDRTDHVASNETKLPATDETKRIQSNETKQIASDKIRAESDEIKHPASDEPSRAVPDENKQIASAETKQIAPKPNKVDTSETQSPFGLSTPIITPVHKADVPTGSDPLFKTDEIFSTVDGILSTATTVQKDFSAPSTPTKPSDEKHFPLASVEESPDPTETAVENLKETSPALSSGTAEFPQETSENILPETTLHASPFKSTEPPPTKLEIPRNSEERERGLMPSPFKPITPTPDADSSDPIARLKSEASSAAASRKSSIGSESSPRPKSATRQAGPHEEETLKIFQEMLRRQGELVVVPAQGPKWIIGKTPDKNFQIKTVAGLLGISDDEFEPFKWIAEQLVDSVSRLPPNWSSHQDSDENLFFKNLETGITQWAPPNVDAFVDKLNSQRQIFEKHLTTAVADRIRTLGVAGNDIGDMCKVLGNTKSTLLDSNLRVNELRLALASAEADHAKTVKRVLALSNEVALGKRTVETQEQRAEIHEERVKKLLAEKRALEYQVLALTNDARTLGIQLKKRENDAAALWLKREELIDSYTMSNGWTAVTRVQALLRRKLIEISNRKLITDSQQWKNILRERIENLVNSQQEKPKLPPGSPSPSQLEEEREHVRIRRGGDLSGERPSDQVRRLYYPSPSAARQRPVSYHGYRPRSGRAESRAGATSSLSNDRLSPVTITEDVSPSPSDEMISTSFIKSNENLGRTESAARSQRDENDSFEKSRKESEIDELYYHDDGEDLPENIIQNTRTQNSTKRLTRAVTARHFAPAAFEYLATLNSMYQYGASPRFSRNTLHSTATPSVTQSLWESTTLPRATTRIEREIDRLDFLSQTLEKTRREKIFVPGHNEVGPTSLSPAASATTGFAKRLYPYSVMPEYSSRLKPAVVDPLDRYSAYTSNPRKNISSSPRLDAQKTSPNRLAENLFDIHIERSNDGRPHTARPPATAMSEKKRIAQRPATSRVHYPRGDPPPQPPSTRLWKHSRVFDGNRGYVEEMDESKLSREELIDIVRGLKGWRGERETNLGSTTNNSMKSTAWQPKSAVELSQMNWAVYKDSTTAAASAAIVEGEKPADVPAPRPPSIQKKSIPYRVARPQSHRSLHTVTSTYSTKP